MIASMTVARIDRDDSRSSKGKNSGERSDAALEMSAKLPLA
jgi:hypothetical protein